MSEPTRAQTVPEMRQAIWQAERDIVAVLVRLSRQLPHGMAVSGVDVDALDDSTMEGDKRRVFEAHIMVEVTA